MNDSESAAPSRRNFLVQLGAGTAVLGGLCPLLGQKVSAAEASQQSADLEEIKQLKARLDWQKASSVGLLIALRDKFGSGIVQAISDHTAEMAKDHFSKMQVKGARDLQALKAALWDRLEKDFETECLENTPARMKFKVNKCPLAENMKKFNAPDIGFALHCASDPGIAAGINPKIKFSRTKTLMQGHDCCDHCYEM